MFDFVGIPFIPMRMTLSGPIFSMFVTLQNVVGPMCWCDTIVNNFTRMIWGMLSKFQHYGQVCCSNFTSEFAKALLSLPLRKNGSSMMIVLNNLEAWITPVRNDGITCVLWWTVLFPFQIVWGAERSNEISRNDFEFIFVLVINLCVLLLIFFPH
jgi:hypothetical protein